MFAWRIRRLDADGKQGPWSNGRKFTLSKAGTTTTVSVTKTAKKVKATGSLTPPLEGSTITVVLSRKQSGKWVKVATKEPAVNAGGGFAASFKTDEERHVQGRGELPGGRAAHVEQGHGAVRLLIVQLPGAARRPGAPEAPQTGFSRPP